MVDQVALVPVRHRTAAAGAGYSGSIEREMEPHVPTSPEVPSPRHHGCPSATPVNIVLGVIGADCHAVGNKILEIAFREAGFRVNNLGVMVAQAEFIAAALETDARAMVISSLCGHAEIDCRGLRERCLEAGIGHILLYLGGNLTVGETDFPTVERRFREMGFDRVFPPGTAPEEGIAALWEDLRRRGCRQPAGDTKGPGRA